MELIKDRLAHIIRAKNLTATQFAEKMQIQPSNVSHLLSGRNKPSLDFLLKLKEVFPEYSFDWIIMGKKPITINEPNPVASEKPIIDFSNENDEKSKTETDYSIPDNPELFDNQQDILNEPRFGNLVKRNSKDPKTMILVYDDNSFEIFHIRL